MFLFPAWTAMFRQLFAAGAVGGIVYLTCLIWYGASPRTTDVGYAPQQPVEYSHALHAGKLAIDCRYCHTHVEEAAHANIPSTEVCMNCHQRIKTKSPKLQWVRDAWATGEPVPWVKVHDLPDYVYFNHSIHVKRGVGCVSCHGRIDTMERVYQHERLSMGWCLECHRAPDKHLRPTEFITKMDWKPPEDPVLYGQKLKEINHIHPPQDCTACHR